MTPLAEKRITVIGGGIAGLTAARDLARLGAAVTLVEKSDRLGGHAGEYGCKAAGRCVKCGACMVEEAIREVTATSAIEIRLSSFISGVHRNGAYTLALQDAGNPSAEPVDLRADAVILATGFRPFDPREKPYGYGKFPNVITNLELEGMLRSSDRAVRPSDGQWPERMAFIQCVGSRDAKLGHLWCSQVCCASALRMAAWIKERRPETEITFFYIDIQTFGRDFETFHRSVKEIVTPVRTLPGDVFPLPEDRLRVVYFDPFDRRTVEGDVDLLVLSVGLVPGDDARGLAEQFGLRLTEDGFLAPPDPGNGVFPAGTAAGPMSIPDAVASAGHAAAAAARFLQTDGKGTL